MDATCTIWGPLNSRPDAHRTVAALHAAGFRRRSLGVVDLQPRPGVERDPVVRWALSRIGRETMRIMLLSLPGLIAVNVALLLLTMGDTPGLAIGIGVAAGAGTSPVAALVGFALAWTRWGELANHHTSAPGTEGYLVVAARGSTPTAPTRPPRAKTAVADA